MTVIQVPAWKKLIVCGDVAVIPAPDLEAKIAILNYAIAVAHSLGIEKPKAVLLSAVEKVNRKMPSTTDAAIISKMADRGQIKGAIVDGPLALDVAFSRRAPRSRASSPRSPATPTSSSSRTSRRETSSSRPAPIWPGPSSRPCGRRDLSLHPDVAVGFRGHEVLFDRPGLAAGLTGRRPRAPLAGPGGPSPGCIPIARPAGPSR